MPTYDYLCDACGHEFELFQSIVAPTKRKCPECGRSKLRRQIGPGAAIMFRGSGFYATDYRSESYKKAAAADKSGAGEKGSAGDKGGAGDKPPAGAAAKTAEKGSGKEKPKAGAR